MNNEFKITDKSQMTDEQLELHEKYITNTDIQNLIYNDGHMISWWEYEHIENNNYTVELHQSNIDEDNFVFISLSELKNIVKKLEKIINANNQENMNKFKKEYIAEWVDKNNER